MKKFLSAVLSGILFVGAAVAATVSYKDTKAINAASQSVFALYGQYNDVEHFLCTASIYDHPSKDTYRLITAGHCFVVPEGGSYYLQADNTMGQEKIPVTVLKHERTEFTGIDFMILEMKSKKYYSSLILDSKFDVKIGDPIFVANFSEGLIKQYALGYIASNTMDGAAEEPRVADCALCVDRFIIHVFASHGASGSSVIDLRTGKVIGLLVGGVDGETLGAFVEPISGFKSWEAGYKPHSSLLDRLKHLLHQ
jgi:hypothetical protein